MAESLGYLGSWSVKETTRSETKRIVAATDLSVIPSQSDNRVEDAGTSASDWAVNLMAMTFESSLALGRYLL